MADDEINPLGTPTTNYGWIKPTVGGDDDAWGGLLNTDLDGIDSTVKSVSTVANAAYPASNPAGYITASAIPAPYVLPTASTTVLGGVKVDGSTVTIAGGTISSSGGAAPSSTPPLMDGIVAVGTGTTFARADHVHPTDTHAMGDNRIINGDMRIDQRNNGASGTAGAYTVDRWQYAPAQASKFTWGRNNGSVGVPSGFGYYLGFISSSAYTPLASDAFQLLHSIEADMVTDFAWGTAQAQSVTLSFWISSSLTGTFGATVRNYAATRAYPFTFSLPTANTWTKIVVTIPGDTAGAWVLAGNAGSVVLCFDLGSGATLRAPAGAWVAGTITSANGAVNVCATNGAQFALTGVKLEIGSVATPYNRQSLAKSWADCQRYYQYLPGVLVFNSYSLAGSGLTQPFTIQTMRATPTGNVTGAAGIVNCSAQTITPYNPNLFYLNHNSTAVGYSQWVTNVSLSAEL